MYYGYSGCSGMNTPYQVQPSYVGNTTGGYSWGAALWIVLFILLVIIIGAGWTGNTID